MLDKSFIKKLNGAVNGFEFEVGVLEDKPHFEAVPTPLNGEPALKTYAGGPARKQTKRPSGLTIGEVLVENMKRLNINLLLRPFEEPNSEILKFTEAFLKLATTKKGSLKRVENLLQAIVRNPILRQEYGKNESYTADNKGFDRHLIDTAQMFKAIRARARRVKR